MEFEGCECIGPDMATGAEEPTGNNALASTGVFPGASTATRARATASAPAAPSSADSSPRRQEPSHVVGPRKIFATSLADFGAIKDVRPPGSLLGAPQATIAISSAPGGETSGRSYGDASVEASHQAGAGTEPSALNYTQISSLPGDSTGAVQPANNNVPTQPMAQCAVARARIPGDLPVVVQGAQGAGTASNQTTIQITQITPLERDVLFGRGHAASNHPGNRLLRAIVQEERPKFLLSKREKKRDFACKIVSGIQRLGGRFLMVDPDKSGYSMLSKGYTTAWICVETEVAIEKVMHRLREKRLGKGVDPTEIDPQLLRDYRLQQGMSPYQSQSPTLATEFVPHGSLPSSLNGGEASLNGSSSLYFIETEKKNTEGFPMPIVEFVRGGHLSEFMTLVRCGDEVETARINTVQQTHMLENAARLSLVLTRLFADHLTEINLESIQLEDFFVNLDDGNGDQQAERSISIDSPHQCPKLIGIHIGMIPRTRCEGLHDQNRFKASSAMQVLGRLLYSIFAFGESPPPHLLDISSSQDDATSHASEEDGIIELLAKSSRKSDKSIFSSLIESNKFPAAICRFLSDLMGVDPACNAGSPFTSFDEVTQDLEQMIHEPQIFLHDSGPTLGDTQPIVFGQTIYGRKEEITTLSGVAHRMMQEALHQPNHVSSTSGLETLFVSGIAGSGKSHLIQQVGENLLSSGWIVIKAKFERGSEHTSRRTVSLMFNEVVKYLVKMKESRNAVDVSFSLRASKAIVDTVGYDKLSPLVDFLPSLPVLLDCSPLQFDGTPSAENVEMQEGENWQLIHSLTKILEAVLESDRFIMICCDDLQWGDETTLSLISEVLVNVSSLKHISRHCLFVGLFRHDEIDDNHPFSTQYSHLQTMGHNINITNIKLVGLSKKDVEDMLKAELRLPHRLVVQLADIVHKKTSGHTFFVSELLNSLLRDSIIAYSPRYQRYSWDHDRIEMIPTGEGVAGLIASNVKSLPQASQRVLHVLSCFGIQTDTSLLQILERFEEGIIASLGTFVEKGILDRAGPIIMFSHDLIQQEVYISLPPAERNKIHLEIGQFLGALANVDRSEWIDPLATGIDLLRIDDDREFFGGQSMTSSLISLACDQINSAGTDAIEDGQRFKFAEWNRTAGEQAYRRHDWRASMYYFSNGITFLGHECWHKEHEQLCLELYNGQAHSHASLGELDDAIRCAETAVRNAPFEDALEAQRVILRSYFHLGKHEECICLGINILQKLNCILPSDPTPESVALAMSVTDSLAANFSKEQIVNLCEEAVDDSAYQTIKISDAIYSSCLTSSSPLMPLIACITIQFSLQHRGSICLESTSAFAAYALMKVGLGDFRGGQWWADVAREVEQKLRRTNNSNTTVVTLSRYGLYMGIDIWLRPLKEISKELFEHHHNCTRTGQTDMGVFCLQTSCRDAIFGGESLLIIQQSYGEKVQLVAKRSKFLAMIMALDGVLLTELTGKPGDYFFAFGGLISDVNDLQAWIQSNDTGNLLYQVLCHNFFVSFWKRDYVSAEQHLHKSLMLPSSRMPSVILIYETFFGGIVAFQLFRQAGGNQRLQEGKEMLDQVDKWAQISMDVFENKWHLLKAEYSASIGQHAVAEKLYEASIKSARACGNIHELALANELLASHYSACRCRTTVFGQALKDAYVYYTQWGATAVAERLLHKHDVDMTSMKNDTERMRDLKRPR